MDFTSLADFNAVATHGGFGPASRALDRPKATLSRRVAELEESLGVRLIERGARRLRLTEEGQALHERTRGLMAEIQEAGEAVASRAPVPRGRLRISAPIVFAHVLLCKIAARFALAYPQVELEIIAEDRVADPAEDGFDLVIRIDPPRDELLVGRCILGDVRMVVASPLMSVPSPSARGTESEDDRRASALVVPAVVSSASAAAAGMSETWTIVTSTGETRTLIPTPVLRLSSLLMIRDATVAGAGAARLPRLLVEDDVAQGRLACLGTEAGPPVEIWALYSSRRLLSAKVRAFLDMLQDLPGHT
ncbi:LysR family transcriptional regulator [Trinickia acidisoli]|uniref:LysR family transcriptional regulator n=1 Tax=Trinickia acidisoli TaxID=2767482 RepID=UPI001A8E1F96|nr:LysR substrate-binding domain-containing protein [Trinickia acidisoli]